MPCVRSDSTRPLVGRDGMLAAALAVAMLLGAHVQAQQGLFVYVPAFTGNTTRAYTTLADGTLTATHTVVTADQPAAVAVRPDQAFAYVTLRSSNLLAVIDTRTHTVIQTVATGAVPIGVAVSPDGSTLAVGNSSSNTASVFSIDNLTGLVTPMATISTGSSPRSVAIGPDGTRAYVVNQSGDSVSVIDLATNTVVATIPVGVQPLSIAVNPDGTRAYVSNFSSSSVSVIDTATNTVVATVPVAGAPYGTATSADGADFYVTGYNTNTVTQYDATTNTSVGSVPTGSAPAGVIVSPDGTSLYAANASGGTVSIFDVGSGGGLTSIGTIATVAGPGYLGMCGNGNGMLASGRTFVANTAAALGCTGIAGPVFTGGTLLVNGAGFATNLSMTLGAAGGTVDTNGHDATVSGAIGGAGGLAKIGAGTLTFGGANTYSGATMVNAGTLSAAGANVFSGSSAVTVASGATLDLGGFAQTVGSIAGSGGIALGAATLTTGGDNTSTTFSGTISGTGGLFKTGTGTLTLSGANTYSGATTIDAGTLRVGSAGALGPPSGLTINAAGTLDLNGFPLSVGSLAGSGKVALGGAAFTLGVGDVSSTFAGAVVGSGTVTKTGTGTLTLTGASTFSGPMAIDGGTVLAGGTNVFSGSSAVTVASGAMLDLGGFAQTVGSIAGSGGIALGAGTLTTGGDGTSTTFGGAISGTGGLFKAGAGTLTLSGANTYSGATTVDVGTLRVGSAGALGATSGLTVNGAGTLDLNGYALSVGGLDGTGTVALGGAMFTLGVGDVSSTFAGSITGNGTVTKTGTGTLTLAGANTYAGATTIEAGTLRVGSSGALSDVGGLSINGGGTLDLNGYSLSTGSLAGSGTVALGGATFTLGVGGVSSTFAGAITGSGTVAKAGAGTLTLAGANTYTGPTHVEAGTLVLGSSTALGAGGPVTVDADATLDLHGFSQSFGGVDGLGTIALGSATLTLGAGDATSTFGGRITGSGGLTKTGTGTLTLSGANTYTGGTQVNAGTLIGTTVSLQGPIANDAALVFDQAFDGTFLGTLSGPGSLAKTGIGSLTLDGAHPMTGTTSVQQGTLVLNGALGGSVVVSPGASFTGTGAIGGSLTVGAGGTPAAAIAQRSSWSTVARPVPHVAALATAGSNATLTVLGELAVTGDLTIGTAGTYQVTLGADGSASLLSAGGTAALDGALITITAAPGQPRRVTQAPVLTADGGLTGRPTILIDDPALEGYTASDGETLFVFVLDETVPLAGAATSANGAAAGRALDLVKTTTTNADLHAVTRELTALDDPGLAVALEAVAGEIHATAVQLAALDGEAVGQTVRAEIAARAAAVGADRAAGAAVQPWADGHRWWARLVGQHGSFDGGDAYGATASLGGFVIGTDWTFGAGWLAGVGGGYSRGDIRLDGLAQSSRLASPGAFGYVAYGRGRWTAHVHGRLARAAYDTHRSIAFTARVDPRFGAVAIFGGVDRTATTDVHGLDTALWGEWTLDVPAGAWVVQPSVGVRYARYGRSAWTETGADAIALAADAQAITSTQATAGARVHRVSGRLRPYAEALYARELGSGDAEVTLRLSSAAAGGFVVSGVPFAANHLLGTVGLTMTAGARTDVSVGYRVDAGSTGTRHAAELGVRF